jgi:competence protein ComEC
MQPVLLAFAATVLGLLLAPVYVFPSLWGWVSLLLLLILAVTLRSWRKASLFILFVIFFILANLRYSQQLSSRTDTLQINQLAKKVMITGQIDDVRQLTDGRSWLAVKVNSIACKGNTIPLESPLTVRLYLGEGTTERLPGDVIRCRTRLRKPRLFGTPGEFNWPRYLAGQHVDMTGWVKNQGKIAVLDSLQRGVWRQIVQWRNRVAAEIHTLMPDKRAYLTRSLVLGEGRVIPDDLRRVLARSGISHLFAISGLHLGLIAILGYVSLLSIYRRIPRLLEWQPPQRIIPLILLPLLLGYLLLTGDAVSTRRAFALAACGAVFIYWRYHMNPLQLLASLAFISLLVNPLLLWQAGWQLSFAGAAGILLWQPLWRQCGNNLPRVLRYFLQLLLVTCAASLATLPFVLLNFHLFAPAGIIANLVCVPLVTLLALPAGFIALLFEPFFSPLSHVLFSVCGCLLDGIVVLAGWLTTLPGLSAHYLFLSHWQYVAVSVFVLPLLLIARLNKASVLRFGMLCLIFGALLWQLPIQMMSSLTLTMFSVGQGESMLLQNRTGQSILVDGGGFYSDRFDVGERLLAPAFGELKVKSLDAVVLTHDDIDHRKGLVFILRYFPVKQFLTGIPVVELHYTLRKVLAEKNIPVRIVPRGWSHLLFWTDGELQVYNGDSAGCSDNNASLVLYLDSKIAGGLLLTGDLEALGVEKLLDAGVPGPVSLLKLPHHGSRFSSVGKLLDQLSPELCLVSSGYQNRYHLPAESVVETLVDRGIPLYRTDFSGTLRASLSNDSWQVEYMQRPLFH